MLRQTTATVMQAPERPADEERRLQTLRALGILDTAPEERFERITRLARRIFQVPIALLSLVDAERQWFKSCGGLDVSEAGRDISFCGHAILGEQLFEVADARLDPRFADNPLVSGPPGIRFYAGHPLRVHGYSLGTLCLIDQRPRQLDAEDRQLLADLAGMAEQELAALHLAHLDPLTGLYNRRGFEALAAHGLRLARRQRHPAALLFIDLDDFKRINDRYGHAEGDLALASLARLMSQALRGSDVLARLGGDEFAVLLMDADAAATAAALKRLGEALEQHNRQAQRGYSLGFSIGSVAFDPQRHADLAALLAEADAAMFRQKRLAKS